MCQPFGLQVVAAAASALPTSAQALRDALRPLTGDWSRGGARGLACNGCGRVQSEAEFWAAVEAELHSS